MGLTEQENLARLIYLNTAQVEGIHTAHNTGTKQVLSKGFVNLFQIKQIAIGTLIAGEHIAEHVHTDMDEHYFCLQGEGVMIVNGHEFKLYEGIYLNVPAMAKHSLTCSSEKLRFIYYSLALNSDNTPT